MAIEDRDGRVADLVEDAVRDELRVASGFGDIGLSDIQIDTLAQAVTSRLLYAFAVDWSPDWVKDGTVHSWESDGQHFARCGVCLLDSPPASDRQTAERWAREHEATHAH